MSVQVLISELEAVSGSYGDAAYVVAGDGAGSPRITHATARWDGGDVVVRLGRSACAAVTANPQVTLLWAATEGEPLSLIVDGVVDAPPPDGGDVRVRPVGAVRHRPAPSSDG